MKCAASKSCVGLCPCRSYCGDFSRKCADMICDMPMSEFNRRFLLSMYFNDIIIMERSYFHVGVLYTILTYFLTLGGVTTTLTLSMSKVGPISQEVADVCFWIGWTFSILMIIANKMVHTFDLSRRYVLGHAVLEKMRSECRQFIIGIGRYTGHMPIEIKFKIFCARMEKLKSDAVNQELHISDLTSGKHAEMPFTGDDTQMDTVSDNIPHDF